MQDRVIDVAQTRAAIDVDNRAKDQRLAQLTQKIAAEEARISKFAEHNSGRVNEVRRSFWSPCMVGSTACRPCPCVRCLAYEMLLYVTSSLIPYARGNLCFTGTGLYL